MKRSCSAKKQILDSRAAAAKDRAREIFLIQDDRHGEVDKMRSKIEDLERQLAAA